MPQPNQISPIQLMRLIGLADCPAIVDVRIPDDIARDPRLIPGSFTAPIKGLTLPRPGCTGSAW